MSASRHPDGRQRRAASFGEILGGLEPAKAARTFQPCRRNSYYANDRRALSVWRPIAGSNRQARLIIGARMKAAEAYDRHRKKPGERNGPLGHIGLEVLRELYRFVDFKTGRLEPAIATICEKVKRSRAAVVAAMARLKEHGFLTWVRRTEPTDNAGAGPQVRQITNAYGFDLPKAAADWVKRKVGPAPAAECELDRQRADAADTRAMLDQVTDAEFVDFVVDDPEMAARLKAIAEALSKKDSASSPSGQNPAPEGL